MTSAPGPAVPSRGSGEVVWIFWDGECGFCRRSVAWLKRQDRHDRLRPVPYQRAPAPPMTPQLRAACGRAVHVLMPDGRVYRAGKAVLVLGGLVGYSRLAAVFGLPPLLWLVEAAYRVVAANRPLLSRWVLASVTVDPVAVGEGPDLPEGP